MWLRKKARNVGIPVGLAVFPEFVAVGTRSGGNVQVLQMPLPEPTLGVDEFVACFRSLLAQLPVTAAQIKCVLSNRLARFSMLPWSSAMLTSRSAERYAHDHMSASFGDAASNVAVRLESAPYGTPRLACAVPRPLLEGLGEAIKETGSTLSSLKPLLVAAVDRSAAKISSRATVVGTLEHGVFHYALAKDARWVQVSSESLSGDGTNDLRVAVRRIEIRNPWLNVCEPMMLLDANADGRSARVLELALAS